jgi:hypothetical protein
MIEMDVGEFMGQHVEIDRSGKARRTVHEMTVAPGEGATST